MRKSEYRPTRWAPPPQVRSSNARIQNSDIRNNFIAAAGTGDLNRVRTLLKADRSLLQATDNNMTGLHLAAWYGHEHVVDYLIRKKADVKALGWRGRNVLMSASECEKDNTSVMEKLTKAGCSVNDRSDHEEKATALIVACSLANVNNVQALLHARANVNLADGFRLQPIHYAAQYGSPECITLLLDMGANVNAMCNFNESPIMRAVLGNKPTNIRCLVTRGGDLNLCNNDGDSALHIAVMEKFKECVKELLKSGCDRNIKNKGGITASDRRCFFVSSHRNRHGALLMSNWLYMSQIHPPYKSSLTKYTPQKDYNAMRLEEITSLFQHTPGPPALHQAFLQNNPGEAQRLLESGNSPNEQDSFGRSALQIVCAASKVAYVNLLLRFKANPDVFDDEMNTPLHLVCSAGSQAIVKVLRDVADVNLPNKDGMTPLLLSSARGHLPVIKILCQHPGLDLQCMDDAGNNALHHAAKRGFVQVCEFLKNLPGAPDMDSRNNANDSPLVVAAKAGQGKVVKAMLIDRVKSDPHLERSMTSVNLEAAKNLFPGNINVKAFEYGKEENMVDLVLQLKDKLNL